MSANQWGGLLMATHARAAVATVTEIVKRSELFTEVDELSFVALKGTRLTWVSFGPFDDFEDCDSLIEDRQMVGAIARKLRVPIWVVTNNDYSGRDYLSFDKAGHRVWRRHDSEAWRPRVDDRVARAEAKAKTAVERRAVKADAQRWLDEARGKSALGQLEREAGIRWDAFINPFGDPKPGVGAWRKRTAARVAAPRRTPEVVDLAEPIEAPDPHPDLTLWERQQIFERIQLIRDPRRTLAGFSLPPELELRLRRAAMEKGLIQDLLVERLWAATDRASLEVMPVAGASIDHQVTLSAKVLRAIEALATKRTASRGEVLAAIILKELPA